MDMKTITDYTAEHGLSLLLTVTFLSFVVWVIARVARRTWAAIEETVFANWSLGLLGATGLVLSLASGWTTWDGMRNFTQEPVLSLMITFGIQGVMLIIAWLIGESFATGMSQRSGTGADPNKRGRALFGSVVGLVVASAVLLTVLQAIGYIDVRGAGFAALDWAQFGDRYLFIGTALLIVTLILVSASDVAQPYLQGARVITKNAMLWVMFLACMATSVFFSFDSLFTAIFPQDQRVRAAELRAQNQVAGMIADIGQTISERRIAEADVLFKADGWRTYDTQLIGVTEAARKSEGAIERYFNEQIEQRNRAIKEQQERIATAQSGQAGLQNRKTSLAEELGRLKGDRPALAADYTEKKGDLDAKTREIDSKRVEALAEDRGVEGTGKEGRGPVWRQRMEELGKLQAASKIAEERLKDTKKRLDSTDTRLAQIERELSGVDGELAKLKGEAETAGQRIKVTEAGVSVEEGQQIDPARLVPVFEKARGTFRQEPTAENLGKVQQICGQIYNAMSSTEPTKALIKDLDCDAKQAVEASAAMFALNSGSQSFDANCAGGTKIAQMSSTDALFGFARRCLADAGLPSAETDALRSKINMMELNRDDKAHRFVVTWNAFEDGNRLAYLALAIAVAIDSLIFLSGLFGANAVRSPLSDVPNLKARSAKQLEATINAALGMRPYETASLVLAALRPIGNVDGFSAMAALDGLDRPAADRVRQVLTAGADIGAVEPAGSEPERYRVRSELREYLSTVCESHLKANPALARRARLDDIIRAALKPHTREHAELVAHAFDPIQPTDGFTSTTLLTSITDDYVARVVRRVMNAGATFDAVRPDAVEKERYYIRPALYEALLEISANDPPSASYEADRMGPLLAPPRAGSAEIEGGNITPRQEVLAKQGQPQLQITHVDGAPGPSPQGPRNILDWLRGNKRGGAAQPAQGGEAASDGDDQSMADNEPTPEMVRVFAKALKLQHRQFRSLCDPNQVPGHLKAVSHTATQLGTIADNDPLFKARLDRLAEAKRRALAQAEAELRRAGEAAAVLAGLSEYLRRIVPLVLLVERGAYERMLEDLRDEGDQLPPQQFPGGSKKKWLQIVQDHLDELMPLPRAEPEHWARVHECLLTLSKHLALLRENGAGQRQGQRYLQ